MFALLNIEARRCFSLGAKNSMIMPSIPSIEIRTFIVSNNEKLPLFSFTHDKTPSGANESVKSMIGSAMIQISKSKKNIGMIRNIVVSALRILPKAYCIK